MHCERCQFSNNIRQNIAELRFLPENVILADSIVECKLACVRIEGRRPESETTQREWAHDTSPPPRTWLRVVLFNYWSHASSGLQYTFRHLIILFLIRTLRNDKYARCLVIMNDSAKYQHKGFIISLSASLSTNQFWKVSLLNLSNFFIDESILRICQSFYTKRTGPASRKKENHFIQVETRKRTKAQPIFHQVYTTKMVSISNISTLNHLLVIPLL